MKERPILFSAPMIKALLAGQKTQTRRAFSARMIKLMSAAASIGEVSWFMEEGTLRGHDLAYIQQFSPYGQPGDRLWVREAWRASSAHDDLPPRDIPIGDAVEYSADAERILTGKLRPGMFMPRRASRIDLEITAVRVDRLQDISEADAIAEGVSVHPDHHGKPRSSIYSPVQAYSDLWESLNGAGAWAVNPWVWAVEFRRGI